MIIEFFNYALNGALLWLALATFSMGIDGYVLAGLLPQIAGDLHSGRELIRGNLKTSADLRS